MSGILGTKIGMTRLIEDDGRVIPITVVKCEPNEVAQIKTTEKDGYPALVLGFSKLKKPTKTKQFMHLKEFRLDGKNDTEYKKGDAITVANFEEEAIVQVTAISKGKGFQGVIKRHKFARGPEGHGSHHHREPGSIGACAKPGRVLKGKKLPGRMGGDQKTLKKVKVGYINSEKNIIGLRCCVPGPNGGLVIIKTTA